MVWTISRMAATSNLWKAQWARNRSTSSPPLLLLRPSHRNHYGVAKFSGNRPARIAKRRTSWTWMEASLRWQPAKRIWLVPTGVWQSTKKYSSWHTWPRPQMLRMYPQHIYRWRIDVAIIFSLNKGSQSLIEISSQVISNQAQAVKKQTRIHQNLTVAPTSLAMSNLCQWMISPFWVNESRFWSNLTLIPPWSNLHSNRSPPMSWRHWGMTTASW